MQVSKGFKRRFDFLPRLTEVVAKAAKAWLEHDASTMGAALAFYTVFSIAPILIIAISIVGIVVHGDILQADLLTQAQNLLGATGASAVRDLLTSAEYLDKSRFATSIGVVTLLFGASSVFVELQNALDKIWEVPKRKRMRSLWQILRARFLSFGLVLGVGFLLMVSLVVSSLMAAFGAWLSSMMGHWRITLFVIDVVLTLGISTVLFALLFKYVPQKRLTWADVWVGGIVTAALFSMGKFAIGYYLGKSAFSSVYGIAGSFLVLLLWTYYSAQIFLFGAEFTRFYTLILGSRVAVNEVYGHSAPARQRSELTADDGKRARSA
jgi:membrane protein